jgi:hypothetical protein
MRITLISLAAAASALAVATPAAAQYQQGYAQPQGYAFGYGQNYNRRGHARALQIRIDRIQRDIFRLAQRRLISRNEHQNLQRDARDIEHDLRRNAIDGRGLTAREMYNTERRIAHLEQKIARDIRDGGNRWGNNDRRYGAYDRDRDGRDDRYEDDRGTRHD